MKEKSQSNLYRFEEQQLLPAEEKLEVKKKNQQISIGLPANIKKDEHCITLTPQAVEILVNAGYEVFIETFAGEKARYTDVEYSDAGAIITKNKADIFQCDYILKVAPFCGQEIDMMKGNQVIFSMLHINSQNTELMKKLQKKKITAIAYEYMKDEHDGFPVMQSFNEISGIVAMNVAAELLSYSSTGKGALLGGIPGISPASVVILGTETAAEYATKAALGVGAKVKIFDNSVGKLRAFEQKFNQNIFTSLYYPRVLEKAVSSADVIIGAQPFNKVPQYTLSTDYVQKMKKGSIIIDLNASQGGCFETTKCTSLSNPTYIHEGVIHYCVPNIAAKVSRTSTIALSNIFSSILLEIGEIGGISHYIKTFKGFRESIYYYNGILTNKDIGRKFHLPTKDLDLLMAAF